MAVPTHINGYPVIASLHKKNDPALFGIIVWREGHPLHPFVVASWWEGLTDGWWQGHYEKTSDDAAAKLMKLTGWKKETE